MQIGFIRAKHGIWSSNETKGAALFPSVGLTPAG